MNVRHLNANHKDDRGEITDIFPSSAPDSVTFITSGPGAIRGNHYHEHTVQWAVVLFGSMWAYSKRQGDPAGNVERVKLEVGDMVKHDPGEIHAYETIGDACHFLAFAEGIRKGTSYEADTHRVPSIVNEWRAANDQGQIGTAK